VSSTQVNHQLESATAAVSALEPTGGPPLLAKMPPKRFSGKRDQRCMRMQDFGEGQACVAPAVFPPCVAIFFFLLEGGWWCLSRGAVLFHT
jgi:hypothetical protein